MERNHGLIVKKKTEKHICTEFIFALILPSTPLIVHPKEEAVTVQSIFQLSNSYKSGIKNLI